MVTRTHPSPTCLTCPTRGNGQVLRHCPQLPRWPPPPRSLGSKPGGLAGWNSSPPGVARLSCYWHQWVQGKLHKWTQNVIEHDCTTQGDRVSTMCKNLHGQVVFTSQIWSSPLSMIYPDPPTRRWHECYRESSVSGPSPNPILFITYTELYAPLHWQSGVKYVNLGGNSMQIIHAQLHGGCNSIAVGNILPFNKSSNESKAKRPVSGQSSKIPEAKSAQHFLARITGCQVSSPASHWLGFQWIFLTHSGRGTELAGAFDKSNFGTAWSVLIIVKTHTMPHAHPSRIPDQNWPSDLCSTPSTTSLLPATGPQRGRVSILIGVSVSWGRYVFIKWLRFHNRALHLIVMLFKTVIREICGHNRLRF